MAPSSGNSLVANPCSFARCFQLLGDAMIWSLDRRLPDGHLRLCTFRVYEPPIYVLQAAHGGHERRLGTCSASGHALCTVVTDMDLSDCRLQQGA